MSELKPVLASVLCLCLWFLMHLSVDFYLCVEAALVVFIFALSAWQKRLCFCWSSPQCPLLRVSDHFKHLGYP